MYMICKLFLFIESVQCKEFIFYKKSIFSFFSRAHCINSTNCCSWLLKSHSSLLSPRLYLRRIILQLCIILDLVNLESCLPIINFVLLGNYSTVPCPIYLLSNMGSIGVSNRSWGCDEQHLANGSYALSSGSKK